MPGGYRQSLAGNDRRVGQRVLGFDAEFEAKFCSPLQDLNGGEIHNRPTPEESPSIGAPDFWDTPDGH
jgi:hypothetical protein